MAGLDLTKTKAKSVNPTIIPSAVSSSTSSYPITNASKASPTKDSHQITPATQATHDDTNDDIFSFENLNKKKATKTPVVAVSSGIAIAESDKSGLKKISKRT